MNRRFSSGTNGGYGSNRPPNLRCFTGWPATKLFAFSKPQNDPAKSKKRPSLTFRQFIKKANPQYRFYKHNQTLIDVLQRVADGKIKRLMIFTPPRHGKSETVSRLFTAYFLYKYPHRWVGLASYAADLAYTLSRNARENYLRVVGAVSEQASAVKQWETGYGGGLWAAGAGGPATGKGGHMLLVDDPIKNAEDAASDTLRAKLQDWWNSTWYTREEPWSDNDPHGAMIVVQTRWHEDDLSGWLLDQEKQAEDEEDRERWHIVNLPAIAEEPQPFPDTCTVESDWRQPGEALCPERRPLEKLRKISNRIGSYFFDALFQQRPSAREGEFFKINKLETVEAAPAGLRKCRAWDLAATDSAGAYTAGVLMGVDKAGVYYVLGVERAQLSADDAKAILRSTAVSDGQSVAIHLPQDPGQAGKGQKDQLIRFLAGFNVKAEPVTGSKETRAFGFAAQLNSGNVKMVAGDWNKAFKEELRQFPRGKYKDQVDSGSDAFNELALGGEYCSGTFRR
ncbi:MAG: phage terminase large subunit [Blastocatellia bacterium]